MASVSKYSSWPSSEVLESRKALLVLRETLQNLDYDSPELDAPLSRFLVVRSCGHIEFSLEQGVIDSLAGDTQPHLLNYVKSGLFRGRNPKAGRIEEFLSSFREGWGKEITDFLCADDELLKRELDFLVSRRNKIAHGQSEGIGRRKALDLCDYSLTIADKILEIVCPNNLKVLN